MAGENDSADKTEDPTQKRLDDAHDRGDVAKSKEINTWFVIAGGTLVLSTFSGSIGGWILMPLRNLIANSWMIHADGPGLMALAQSLEYVLIAVLGVPLLMLALAAIAGNMVQHRLGWSGELLKPKLRKNSPVAGASSSGIDGAVRPGNGFGCHHQPDPASIGRRRGDARGCRDRRLFLPVPAVVRAAEDVAAGNEAGVQAIRRRPARQGPDQAIAPGADEEAHDGCGSQGLR